MAISRPGIKRIAIADAGTMTGTPTNLVSIGLREPAALMITELDGYRDHRGRALRNKLNFKVEAKSFQVGYAELGKVISLYKSGVIDAQIYMERGQTSGNNENELFKFYEGSGEYGGMGMDFSFVRNAKESYCTVTLECMKDYTTGYTLINAATINAAMVPETIHENARGEYYGNVQGVSDTLTLALRDSAGVAYSFNLNELTDYEFIIRTRGRKNVLNQTIAGVFEVQLSLTGADATIERIVTLAGMGYDIGVALLAGSGYFLFPANRLMHIEETTIGDEKREIKVTLKGDIPLEDMVRSTDGTNWTSDRFAPGANLSGLTLVWWYLESANLTGANLNGTNLTNANLVWANLTNAVLRNTNLNGADLSNCNLTGADCVGANFTGATMPANADTKEEFKALVGSWDAESTIWTDDRPIGE